MSINKTLINMNETLQNHFKEIKYEDYFPAFKKLCQDCLLSLNYIRKEVDKLKVNQITINTDEKAK
jgi:hypothetical protein